MDRAETGVRKRWFLLPALLLAGAIGIALVVGPDERGGPAAFRGSDHDPSLEELRTFDEFALFYPGDSVGGLSLERVLRNKYTVVNNVTFIYGTCDPGGGEGGCAPPLQVQVSSACVRNLGMYSDRYRPPPVEPGRRGVRLYRGGGDLEFHTADSTVVVFAWTPELALAAIDALRGLNVPVGQAEPLPKPVPGALDGTLDCSGEAAAVREIRERLGTRPGG